MIARKMYGITISRFVPFSHVSLSDYSLKLAQRLPSTLSDVSVLPPHVCWCFVRRCQKCSGDVCVYDCGFRLERRIGGSRVSRKNSRRFYLCVILFRLQISGQIFYTLFHSQEFGVFELGASASSFSAYSRRFEGINGWNLFGVFSKSTGWAIVPLPR